MKTDNYYMSKAQLAAKDSTCRKKQLGCLLVTSKGIEITGTNGPPFPLHECPECPRQLSDSGTDLHKCRAVHAERQTILKAARLGFETEGSTLYSYMGVPCHDCMVELIYSGVKEIVCIRETYYDELSKSILNEWVSKGGKFRTVK